MVSVKFGPHDSTFLKMVQVYDVHVYYFVILSCYKMQVYQYYENINMMFILGGEFMSLLYTFLSLFFKNQTRLYDPLFFVF